MISGIAPRVGGAERQTERLSHALMRCGVRVRILTAREGPGLPERDSLNGIPVRRISYPRVRGLGAVILMARVFSDLMKGSDDVIHVHIPGPLLFPALLASSLRRVPVVLKFANLSPERGIWVDLPPASLPRGLLEAASRRVAGVVAISSRIARAAEEGGWREVARVPNGIDPVAASRALPARALARRALGVGGEPLVLFVGRLTYQKGLDVLLKAWPRFRDRRPGATLLVLGQGPDRNTLRQSAEALGIAASVDFRGIREDVGHHYAAADIFVLPSRYEGFPNVMLEAMAAGLPVIASQVSGTEDAIEDGRNGLLVPPGEPEALSEALRRLSEDPDLRERLGTEARKTVEGRFNINRVAEQTLGFYRHLIGGSQE